MIADGVVMTLLEEMDKIGQSSSWNNESSTAASSPPAALHDDPQTVSVYPTYCPGSLQIMPYADETDTGPVLTPFAEELTHSECSDHSTWRPNDRQRQKPSNSGKKRRLSASQVATKESLSSSTETSAAHSVDGRPTSAELPPRPQAFLQQPVFVQGFGRHGHNDLFPANACLLPPAAHLPSGVSRRQATPAAERAELLPIYPNAAAAPSRLPAHRPVRLSNPKHHLAPEGTPVFFKYGEEHYTEESVPDDYTFTESDGTVCRYITNFLVYNKRGERLLPIEVLDQPRHGALVLYGSLLPASAMGRGLKPAVENEAGNRSARKSSHRSRRGEEDIGMGHASPYPTRVELSEWCIDYGQEPQNVPFIWLISRWDVYYRLEKPAGRYIPTFASAKMKFEVSTRVIKTLQWDPIIPYRDLVELLTAATRQERSRKGKNGEERKRRRSELSEEERANGSETEIVPCRISKKNSRPNWKVHCSLATPEGTGVRLKMADGQPAPLSAWKAPFAVEGVRESTLLGLTDFIESQLRNFLEGVGGNCPNLLETRFMQTLREKASLRRETMQLGKFDIHCM